MCWAFAFWNFGLHGIHAIALTSLLLTYVQSYDTLPCVTTNNSRLPFASTLLFSYSCTLFVVAKKVNSFGIKQIQTLFAKHPAWGGRENRVFGINNIQTLFSDSVCKSVTPAALRSFSAPRCLPGDPIYSLLFQPLRQLRVLCASALSSRLPFLSRLPAAAGLCFHNDTNCFSRLPAGLLAGNSFVFTTIRIARGVLPPAAIPLATRHSPLLPWTP
jgi:hypothetical protein